ncbi:hypothetical protein ACH5RR_040942 [Cinchona calisaya]|uniref:Uncharacterized protein n=1 Tax=Cinchona calisaya TaxID=153742 RepID=A0ABD2XW57_9GENT
MAALQSMTGGQPCSYSLKSFVDVVSGNTPIVPIKNLLFMVENQLLYLQMPKYKHSNDEYRVLHPQLVDDDEDSRKSTKANNKTIDTAQNANLKMAQIWQPKTILKHTDIGDSSAVGICLD